MGILAPFLFIILILVLGFRYDNWNLGFLIFLLGGVFSALLARANIDEIRKNWNDNRCDLGIMLTANLYKPDDDIRTGGEFAAENFTFCTQKIILSIILQFLTPIFAMINSQLDITDSVNDSFNRLRLIQANFLKGFYAVFNPIVARFKNSGTQFMVNQLKISMAMGRAFGITQAVLYLGMTLVTAVENFVEFVIRVILIVLYIILGLMILIFFMILPVFGIIIWVCQVIGNSPFGYMSESVCGELCFDPHTKVKLKNGLVKSIGECVLGDVFEDGTIIEGILQVNGEHEPIFSLDGIRVSGAHLVWFDEKKEWIPVVQHPRAEFSMNGCPRLICLRTSTRNIPLRGLTRQWTFRDWEELPMGIPTSDTIWDFLVSEILNEQPSSQEIPTEHPLLKADCHVMYKTGEVRPVSQIQIGDILYSAEGFTKVTGIYQGEATFPEDSPYTDGIWIKPLGQSQWSHPTMAPGATTPTKGFHLTTESGSFWIQTKTFSGFVRDFTEVGTQNISLTYNYTRQLLKKSFSREESCVSVSLSQVLSSCSQPIS